MLLENWSVDFSALKAAGPSEALQEEGWTMQAKPTGKFSRVTSNVSYRICAVPPGFHIQTVFLIIPLLVLWWTLSYQN